MESLIHLFNTALGRLGGEQLPLNRSPLEDDATGTLCANLFPHVLDTVLSAHEWGFAKKRVALALLPEQTVQNPVYQFRYAIPSDCVKPVRLMHPTKNAAGGAAHALVADRSPAYHIEGTAILCNVKQAELLYVARVKEPKVWPPLFADSLAWAMAGELSSARINDTNKQQWCYQNYEVSLAKACAQDRAQQNPQKVPTPWQAARGNTILNTRRGSW